MAPNLILLFHAIISIISLYSCPSNDNTASTVAIFDKFQRISVGTSDKMICIPIMLHVGTFVSKGASDIFLLWANQHLSHNDIFSLGDLMSTVSFNVGFDIGYGGIVENSGNKYQRYIIFSLDLSTIQISYSS